MMPPVSAVAKLPQEVRDDLNGRLVAQGFGGYEDLSEWLASRGYAISKSALHRHGQDLKADYEEVMAEVRRTTELAKTTAADPDAGPSLMAAAEKIAQDGLIRLQIALRKIDPDPLVMAKVLPQITRAIADLNRSGISREKWQQEAQAKIADLEAEATGKKPGARKLDAETLRIVRQEVYGLV